MTLQQFAEDYRNYTCTKFTRHRIGKPLNYFISVGAMKVIRYREVDEVTLGKKYDEYKTLFSRAKYLKLI